MSISENIIETKSSDLIASAWNNRAKYGFAWTQHLDYLKRIPEIVVKEILGAKLLRPDSIPPSERGVEVAGIVDRKKKTITISNVFPREWRQFTLAHEIGHYVLHPAEIFHRDRPLKGGEKSGLCRPTIELEADSFAGFLLMPTELLELEFRRRFKHAIAGLRKA